MLWHYKVDRVFDVNVESLKFAQPGTLVLAEWMSSSFSVFRSENTPQCIVVQFSREVARFVEESRLNASQNLTREADGNLRAEFEFLDTTEIKRWIMSFGP